MKHINVVCINLNGCIGLLSETQQIQSVFVISQILSYCNRLLSQTLPTISNSPQTLRNRNHPISINFSQTQPIFDTARHCVFRLSSSYSCPINFLLFNPSHRSQSTVDLLSFILSIGDKGVSSEVRVVQVDIPAAEILLVELRLCTRSLIFTFEEHKGVASWTTIVHVNDDVPVRHSEVTEEVSDLPNTNRVRKSAHLQGSVPVVLVHEIRESDRL